ncbi:MAG: NAD-dependent epimerase/dehydratase family protein [Thermoleophilaceae bacterium]
MRRACVLGGGGFIGRCVVSALRGHGVHVTVAGRAGPYEDGDWVGGDLGTRGFARMLGDRRIDAVFDFAGYADPPRSFEEPLDTLEENTAATVRRLEALQRIPQDAIYVYASSAAIYGAESRCRSARTPSRRRCPPTRSRSWQPSSTWPRYHRAHGLPAIALRMFSVYGPGQRKQVVYDLIRRALLDDGSLEVFSPPGVTRDFVYVRDVAEAAVALADRAPACGEIYNVASGRETTMRELATTILDAAGIDRQIEFDEELRAGSAGRNFGSTERIRELGIEPSTPLGEGIGATVKWVRRTAGSLSASLSESTDAA